jgi:hypothetical protein
VGRAPVGDYQARPIRGNFSPVEYGNAITEAEADKLDALIIDSASHEWEGAGGVLGMAAANQASGKKGVLVWQQPKMDHQRHFMLRLMQTPIPLVIVCMRAKYPMIEKKNGNAREWVRSETLEPKQADDILFEMFVHGWIDQQHKLHVTKYTLPELANIIRDCEPISLETGQRLAAWARGEQTSPVSPPSPAKRPASTVSPVGAGTPDDDMLDAIKTALQEAATRGTDAFREEWTAIHPNYQRKLEAEKERLKPIATEADQQMARAS